MADTTSKLATEEVNNPAANSGVAAGTDRNKLADNGHYNSRDPDTEFCRGGTGTPAKVDTIGDPLLAPVAARDPSQGEDRLRLPGLGRPPGRMITRGAGVRQGDGVRVNRDHAEPATE